MENVESRKIQTPQFYTLHFQFYINVFPSPTTKVKFVEASVSTNSGGGNDRTSVEYEWNESAAKRRSTESFSIEPIMNGFLIRVFLT